MKNFFVLRVSDGITKIPIYIYYQKFGNFYLKEDFSNIFHRYLFTWKIIKRTFVKTLITFLPLWKRSHKGAFIYHAMHFRRFFTSLPRISPIWFIASYKLQQFSILSKLIEYVFGTYSCVLMIWYQTTGNEKWIYSVS